MQGKRLDNNVCLDVKMGISLSDSFLVAKENTVTNTRQKNIGIRGGNPVFMERLVQYPGCARIHQDSLLQHLSNQTRKAV